ncbi:PucR family transcriptional regulator [Nocardia sienata]|uniref:PucR family transcriptional regulator n=1 Tax=Nocardia sienata TaxID=248552 RepID=UPI000A5CBC06|nr:helix-turn-helix domain-containing protein [Nocardia sienata]
MDLLFPKGKPGPGFDIVVGIATVVQLLNLMTSTISKIYVRELKSLAADHHTGVHTLTSALLAGHTTSTTARESAIRVAAHYHVLAVAVPAHSDERNPQLDRRVVARRKLRRLQSALAGLSGNQVLSLLSVDGGTILVPAHLCTDVEIENLVAALSTAAQVPITATVIFAETGKIPAATRHAHELLDTVEQLGRGPGLHRLSDLAMEYQITRPGTGRTVLVQRLGPLDEHPELLRTLRIYIDTGLNRQRTARSLSVHPNTIDYRLQRISELIGLDISDTRTWWYLNAALLTRAAADAPRRGLPTPRNHRPHPAIPRRALPA